MSDTLYFSISCSIVALVHLGHYLANECSSFTQVSAQNVGVYSVNILL